MIKKAKFTFDDGAVVLHMTRDLSDENSEVKVRVVRDGFTYGRLSLDDEEFSRWIGKIFSQHRLTDVWGNRIN